MKNKNYESKITDFKLSWCFNVNGKPAFRCGHHVNMDCVADISKEHNVSNAGAVCSSETSATQATST
jgi:hypothetical protein